LIKRKARRKRKEESHIHIVETEKQETKNMATDKIRTISNIVPGIFLLVVIGTFIACDSERVYEDYHTIDNSSWHQDSLLTFDVDIKDLSATHNILFNVRNSGTYRYNNLWLFIFKHKPDGEIVIDSMELSLANPETGEWYGRGLGDIYDKQYLYKEALSFPDTGRYVFNIQHGMRTDGSYLEGIKDFGLRVEKNK
jgi:gliding motility-associated lipoprotein GldH